ncbi:alpha/beta fold hydrolase [Thermogutta sp.]|uniref:alpha/beta fold hydrolase n=1 Tax=Thermogutta sp. TaxID=1962930 RepID=UPI003220193F
MLFYTLLFLGWIQSRAVICSDLRFPHFLVHVLDPDAQFCACGVVDVNHDGKLDIVSGGWWYEAPTWKRHFLRDVPIIRGRFDDYSNLVLDVDGDGWDDLLSANYRSELLLWIRHPGAGLGPWEVREIAKPGPMETGRLYDINGDGQQDILPNGVKFAAWWEFKRLSDGSVAWYRHDLPQEIAGHGIGFGDVDGDGRGDIVTPRGWWQQKGAPDDLQWVKQPEFELHPDASVPIIVADMDGDGDSDIVWGRGHNVGLYWLEQRKENGTRSWTFHAIDTSWSQAHALLLADVNDNGWPEVITGKRYLGHDGRDPGEWHVPVVYAYEYDEHSHVFKRYPIAEAVDVGWGLDPKAADLDGDGDVDFVAADRNGLFWFENLGYESDGESRPHEEVPLWARQNHQQPLQFSSEGGEIHSITSLKDWGYRRWHIQRGMEAVMGGLPGPQMRVPLDVQVIESQETESYRRIKLTYQADPFDRVPAYLLIPHQIRGRHPAVLCLHQTTHLAKDEPAGTRPEAAYPYAHELACRGYVCVVPDYPSFGEHPYDFRSHTEYASGSMKAIWDNVRALDLLESLPEVDRDRIAVIGHSLGGHNALFTAVFDERIRAVICSCGFTAFHRYYGGKIDPWAQDRYMPRVRDVFGNDPRRMPFDFHEVLAALAPRSVFVVAPLRDDNFDVEGVREVATRARHVFRLYGAEDRLVVIRPDIEHGFPPEIRQQTYDWLNRQFNWNPPAR